MINVLSGAAVEPGLVAATDIFRKRTGKSVEITYATTPEIRRLFGAGAAPHAAGADLPRADHPCGPSLSPRVTTPTCSKLQVAIAESSGYLTSR